MISKDVVFGRGDFFTDTGPLSGGTVGGGAFDWGTIFRVGTSALLPFLGGQSQLPVPRVGGLPIPGVGGSIDNTGIADVLRRFPPPGGGSSMVPSQRRLYARGKGLKKCGQPLKSGKMGKCHRTMNPCNHRALTRAYRRLSRFRHFAAQVEKHFPHKITHRRSGGSCKPCQKR